MSLRSLNTAMLTMVGVSLIGGPVFPAEAAGQASFAMVRSKGLPATCAPKASAKVTIVSLGFAEKMTVAVSGLKGGTALDGFVIQVPSLPFGVAWYFGDLQADASGKVTKTFISRFNKETFAVAVGAAPAPRPHQGKDAGTNPAFKPIHTFHLGTWFNSPGDAAKNGCPTVVTPFNGDHTAGIQVLSTRNFADGAGPLGKVD